MTTLYRSVEPRRPRSPRWVRHPLALVYRGPASLPGCPEAVAELLSASRYGWRVEYIGPREKRRFTPASLADAALYAQPGGEDLDDAYRHLRPHARAIRTFVADGGGYLGFCLGGYLAGCSPGFDLLPGDSAQYIGRASATVRTEGDTVVEVTWRGRRRLLFFQDGPYFRFNAGADVQVLATYPDRAVAAAVTNFGRGRVGVVGPHPEAGADWFFDAELPDPGYGQRIPMRARGQDLGLDLLAEVMGP